MLRRVIGSMAVSRVVSVVLGVFLVLRLLPLDDPHHTFILLLVSSFLFHSLFTCYGLLPFTHLPLRGSTLLPLFSLVAVQALYDRYIDNTTSHSLTHTL